MNSRIKNKNWDRISAIIIFIAPTLLFFCTFIIKPVVTSIIYSFMKVDVFGANMTMEFVGLKNFIEVFHDEVFWRSARNTIIWAITSPLLEIPLGLILALALQTKMRGARFFRAAWFTPVLLPQVVVGIIWAWIFNSEWGLLNKLLGLLHLSVLEHAWLGDPNTALFSLIFVTTWVWAGFNMILLLAAVSSVSQDITEAAKIDGAGYWYTVFYVVIPIIKPVILNAMILCFIGKMKVFDLIWVTTKGGPLWATETVATYTVKRAFYWGTFEKGYPSAMAAMWFLVILIVSVISNTAVRKAQENS